MTETSRKKLLLGMLGVLVLVFGWQQLPDVGSSRGSAQVDSESTNTPRRSRNARRGRQAAQPKEVKELLVDALNPQPQQFKIGRNLWAFYTPPAPPPPPPVVVAKPPVIERPVIKEDPPKVDPGPRLPTIRFTYLGSFGPKDRKIAVLAEDDELLNALEGEVIKKNFRVAKIGFESVYIEYVDFPDAEAAQLKVGG